MKIKYKIETQPSKEYYYLYRWAGWLEGGWIYLKLDLELAPMIEFAANHAKHYKAKPTIVWQSSIKVK